MSVGIDIKTLRVGSHVEYRGKRVKVEQVSTIHPKDNPISVLVSHNNNPEAYVSVEELNPIAITTDLLTELGFKREPNVDKKRYFDYLWTRENDDTCWLYREYDNFYLLQSNAFGQIHVKYLHEAEAFLCLTTKTELIKEE